MSQSSEFVVKFGDNPIPGDEPVLLGFDGYADLLTTLIDRADMPTTLGIFGAWGTGKTTLMHKLQAKLEATDRFDTLWCDIWRYDDRGSMRKALVRTVYSHMRQGQPLPAKIREYVSKSPPVVASIAERIKTKLKGLGVEVEFDPEGLFAEVDALFKLDELFTDRFEKAFQDVLAEHLANTASESLVIFLDDLDRCSPPGIVSALEATKLYLDLPHVAFVVGCDAVTIAKAVVRAYGEETGISGHEYLGKMFQMQFAIPTPSPPQVRKYEEACRDLLRSADDISEVYWPTLSRALGYNPRRIKRLAMNHRAVMLRAPELDGDKTATAVALQVGFPDEFQHMSTSPHYLLGRQEKAADGTPSRQDAELSEGIPPSPEGLRRGRLLELLRVAGELNVAYDDSAEVVEYLSYASSPLAEGHQEALLDLLITQLNGDDQDAQVRAASSLGRVAGTPAEAPLLGVLDDTSESDEVRRAAISALGECGTSQCIKHLAACARDDSLNDRIRSACVAALGRVARDAPLYARTRAVRGLTKIADSTSHAPTRYTAIAAIGRAGAPDAIPWLEEAMDEADEREAAVIAKALGGIRTESAARVLAGLLSDEDRHEVRQAAANAIVQVGEDAVEPLVEVLSADESRGASAWAMEALAQIGPIAGQPVRNAVRDAGPAAPPRLISLLGLIGDNEDIELLTGIHRNADSHEASLAAERAIDEIRSRETRGEAGRQ